MKSSFFLQNMTCKLGIVIATSIFGLRLTQFGKELFLSAFSQNFGFGFTAFNDTYNIEDENNKTTMHDNNQNDGNNGNNDNNNNNDNKIKTMISII